MELNHDRIPLSIMGDFAVTTILSFEMWAKFLHLLVMSVLSATHLLAQSVHSSSQLLIYVAQTCQVINAFDGFFDEALRAKSATNIPSFGRKANAFQNRRGDNFFLDSFLPLSMVRLLLRGGAVASLVCLMLVVVLKTWSFNEMERLR